MTVKKNGSRTTSTGTLLSLEDIIGHDDHQYDIVNVPEWGGKVRVRGLSARERDDYEASLMYTAPNGQQKMNYSGARERMVALGLVDAEGKQIATPADAARLGQKSARALERVFTRIRDLSGMSKEDVESLVGNSEGARSDASS